MEFIVSVLAFLIGIILFYKYGLGNNIGPWKALLIGFCIIILSFFIFYVINMKSRLILIFIVIVTSVFVTSRFFNYINELKKGE